MEDGRSRSVEDGQPASMITMCYCFRFHFLIFSQSGDLVWPCRGFYHLCQVSSLFIPIVFAGLLLAEWMDGWGWSPQIATRGLLFRVVSGVRWRDSLFLHLEVPRGEVAHSRRYNRVVI